MSEIYRFKVTIQDHGRERYLHIAKDEFVIGRSRDADVHLPSDMISREQVRVSFDGREIWIEELGSSNGTWLDNKRIVAKKKLQYAPDQLLSLGSKDGPFLKIEAFAQEEIEEQPLVNTFEEWVEEKKVVGGAEAPFTPPKKMAPPKEKLSVIPAADRPDDRILQIKSEGEKKLFLQIKEMLGDEAEEIRSACLEEANRIRKNAEEYSLKHYRDARDKADRALKDADAIVGRKMNELKLLEADSQKRLDTIRQTHLNLERNVYKLKDSEANLKQVLADTQRHIEQEERRIGLALSELEKKESQFENDRQLLDVRIEEQEQSAIAFKSRMETELHDANAKLTEIQSLYQTSLSQRNNLLSEISLLTQDRTDQETRLNEVRIQISETSHNHERILEQLATSTSELEGVKRELANTLSEIQNQKEGLNSFILETEENKRLSEEKLKLAEEEVLRLVGDAQEKVKELESRRVGLTEEVAQEYQKLKTEQEHAVEKLLSKKADLLAEIERIAVTAHEEYHKTVSQGKEEAERIKLEANMTAEEIRKLTESEASRIKLEANSTAEEIRKIAEAEASRMKLEAQEHLGETKTRAHSLMEQTQNDILKERSQFLHEIEGLKQKRKEVQAEIEKASLEKEVILDEAKARGRELLAEAERSGNELRRKINEAAQAEAKGIVARGTTEYNDNKVKLQNQLTEFKHAEMLKIKEARSQAEEEWVSKRTERARTVSNNVYALVAGEMFKARNKVLDENFIDTFSKELKEIVIDTMLDRVGQDTDKLQQILKTSEDAKNKEKRFWRKVQITAGASIAILLIVLVFPQVLLKPRDLIISAFQKSESNSSDRFLEKVKEARIKAVYNPPTTIEFKTSYVDNILFTTDFLGRLNNQAYQDKWILDLNDWFIRDLDVKDTTIIKFVSLESNLLKELEQMKSKIDPANPSVEIEKMRERETLFKQKLSEVFGDPAKVQRYYEFSEKFWKDFYHPRQPSSTTQFTEGQ